MADPFGEINVLADRYRELDGQIRLEEFRTPLNREKEKQELAHAFEGGEVYNPHFVYKAVPSELERDLSELLRAITVTDEWSRLLAETVANKVQSIKALRARDPRQLTELSIELYGSPDRDLVDHAHRRLAAHEAIEVQPLTVAADEAAAVLAQVLDQVGLRSWKVEVTEAMNARMSVHASAQRVRVRAGTKFSPSDVNRLIVHEIGTHAFRAANGARQPLRILGVGLAGYLKTEEGLAIWQEESHGVLSPSATKRHWLRVLAVQASLRGSFFDAYRALRAYVEHDEAFEICVRVKRGVCNTASPGAHTKDYLYARGHLDVAAHLGSKPEDLTLLLVGKVGLEMIDRVRDLLQDGAILPPAYEPAALTPLLIH
jgi:uncharacterized protein (TIGR02421 family)